MSAMHQKNCGADRGGVQLLELTISMMVASILVAGLGTSIYIAGRSTGICTETHQRSLGLDLAAGQIEHDLHQVFQVGDWTSGSITASSLDHSSSRCNWEGPGHPLEVDQHGQWQAVTQPLDDFSLGLVTQSITPSTQSRPTADYHYEEAYVASTPFGTSLTGQTMDNMQDGDLLVAVVGLRNANPDSVTASAGWTKILSERHLTAGIGMCAFYRLSPPPSNPVFKWTGFSAGYCMVTQLRTPGCTIVEAATLTGSSSQPVCPASSFPTNDGCVFRAVVSRSSIYSNTTGMLNFSRVGIRHDLLSGYCIGVVWRASTSPEPEGHFTLQSSAAYVTSTMVFQ